MATTTRTTYLIQFVAVHCLTFAAFSKVKYHDHGYVLRKYGYNYVEFCVNISLCSCLSYARHIALLKCSLPKGPLPWGSIHFSFRKFKGIRVYLFAQHLKKAEIGQGHCAMGSEEKA